LGEIIYQTILHGYNASLVKDKKRAFIPWSKTRRDVSRVCRMTKSMVCVDISLEHKVQHSEKSILGLNHQQASLIFNGGDPISSSDQWLLGGQDFKVAQGLTTRQRSQSLEVNMSH
jgi:hypothetical protein